MNKTLIFLKDNKNFAGSYIDNVDLAICKYKTLLDMLKSSNVSKIYTYNLARNGGIELIKDLFLNGFRYNKDTLLKNNDFFYLIDTDYKFLFIRIRYNRRIIHFYDLDNFYNVDIEELKTLEDKFNAMKYAVLALPQNHAYTLTGQTANEYKKYLKEKGVWLNTIFERLPEYTERFCAQSFVGGICAVNKKYINQKLKVFQYDYNNMYGYILANCLLPFGQPEHVKGNSFNMLDDYTVSIQHIRAQIKSKSRVKWFKMKTDISFYEKIIDDTRYKVDIWITSIDFEELKKDYDIIEVEFLEGFIFEASQRLFDDYVIKNYELKSSAENGWIEQLYKGYNNRLFGYFGRKTQHNYIEFDLDKKNMLKVSKYQLAAKPVYCPIAAFVAAYGRKIILKYIRKYYNDWIYTDCDSLFMTREIKELTVSNKMGDFKLKKGVVKFFGIKKYIFNYETFFAGLKKQYLSYNVKKGDVIISQQYSFSKNGIAKPIKYKYTI